jgi:hypothetical protein
MDVKSPAYIALQSSLPALVSYILDASKDVVGLHALWVLGLKPASIVMASSWCPESVKGYVPSEEEAALIDACAVALKNYPVLASKFSQGLTYLD